MKSKLLRVLLIVTICLGVIGFSLFVTGLGVYNKQSIDYAGNVDRFQGLLYAVGNTCVPPRPRADTETAVKTFLNEIPAYCREKNNVVVVDENGNILYKYNNQYLHTDANQLTLVWNYGLAALADENGDLKYWYSLGVLCSTDVFSSSARILSSSVMKFTREQIESMISDRAFNNGIEADLTICGVGDQDNPKAYVLWFSESGTSGAVYNSMGSEGIQSWYWVAFSGAIVFLVYWGLAPVWVFLDARRRKTQPLPWALLVLLTNLIGLIVYWIVQSQNEKAEAAHVCPVCGKPVRKEHLYCPWCAEPLVKGCKGCGKALERAWVACPWCGKPVE